MHCKAIVITLCVSGFSAAGVAADTAERSSTVPMQTDVRSFSALDRDAGVSIAEAALDTRVSAAFEQADGDGDGKLTRGEFAAMAKDARAYGLPRARQAERVPLEDRDRIFQALDWDGDGKVSKVEAAGDKRVLEDFERADADDNGFLSRPELNRVLALGHR